MTPQLKDLYAQRSALNDRIGDIEAEERIKENAEKVGKAFVYDNGYSHQERWPLYTLVTDIDENGWFNVFQFETDSRGKTSVGNETRFSMSDSYREIDRDEFDLAWARAMDAITQAMPPRA